MRTRMRVVGGRVHRPQPSANHAKLNIQDMKANPTGGDCPRWPGGAPATPEPAVRERRGDEKAPTEDLYSRLLAAAPLSHRRAAAERRPPGQRQPSCLHNYMTRHQP